MRFLILFLLSIVAAFAQYAPYYTDNFSTIDSTKWWVNNGPNGTLIGTVDGLKGKGSLISKLPIPDSTSDYAVKATMYLPNSGSGSAGLIYLRASNNALQDFPYFGSYYAITIGASGSSGNRSVNLAKRESSGATAVLFSTTLSPSTGSITTVEASVRSDGADPGIRIRIEDNYWYIPDTTLTTGSPGVGVRLSGNISNVELGPLDRITPNPIPGSITHVDFPDKVILNWNSTTDDTNGVGVSAYSIYRDNVLVGQVPYGTLTFANEGLTANTTYDFSVVAEDWHGNKSTANIVTLTTPAYSDQDPRRIGITPTSSHWGAMGEQIDLLSGNLHFSLPILNAMGRGGLSHSLALHYNSQNLRFKNSQNVKHGADVGYGFGWRLSAGSIIPVYDGVDLLYYVFTDSTGAEHKLDFDDGGVWRGTSGLNVYYDETLERVYFNNGTFWQMDCISAGTEQDAGTRYPTLIQSSNGNQIVIRYMPAIGSSTLNTSARIKEIDDIRSTNNTLGGYWGYKTYFFSYSSDPIPHLLSIINSITTSEKYTFSYSSPASLVSPFNSASLGGASVPMLASVTVTGLGLGHNFEYTDQYGELTKIIFPYGGELRYDYSTFTYTGGHQLREVDTRYLVKQTGATPAAYPISRNPSDSSLPMHSSATLNDAGGEGQRYWEFSTANDWTKGLQIKYEERALPSGTALARQESSWALATSGFPYIASSISTIEPGSIYEKKSKKDQSIDGYGNLLQVKEYGFNSLVTPEKETNCTYKNDPDFINRYLRNLIVSCVLTTGGSNYTLFTNSYGNVAATVLINLRLHDSVNYGTTMHFRGNITSTSTPAGTTGQTFNMAGVVVSTSDSGKSQQVAYSSTYVAPSTITTNSNSQIQSSFSYTSFLGVSNASQANGASVSFTYDGYARPATKTTPDGLAALTYATGAPWWSQSTLGGVYQKQYFDGFGRTIKTEVGNSSGIQSITETEYDSCACSPLGKVKRTSRPYAPGGTVFWMNYVYDALGRTVSVVQPSGSGSTSYTYQGNTVQTSDPTGRWKKFTSDAFGNLIQVNEPNPAGGSDYVTTYTYNWQGKLINVSMPRPTGTQTRTYVYNSAGQLTSETIPESGTTTYTYSGKFITQKIDAKNQKTEWSYDNYHRVTQERHYKWVSGSYQEQQCQRIDYKYDSYTVTAPPGFGNTHAWGRLAETRWGSDQLGVCPGGEFREQYAYNFNGQNIGKSLILRHPTHALPGGMRIGEARLTATWNWRSGQIIDIRYPDWHSKQYVGPGAGYYSALKVNGATVNTSFDSMIRPSALTRNPGNGNPIETIVNNITYGPAGELTQLEYNSITETFSYNNLGQLTGISYNGVLRHEYRYSTTANDGRITSYKNWQSGEDVQYQYDSLARLISAETIGPDWGQSFGYDGFGNLLSKTVTKGTATTLSITADPLTNRVSTMSYDANGNVTNIPGIGTINYDGRNRYVGPSTYQTVSRIYDPRNTLIARLGQNVQEAPGVTTQTAPEMFVDFYLPDGKKLGTYKRWYPAVDYGSGPTLAFTAEQQHIYFGSRLVKTIPLYGSPSSPRQDRLGSMVRHFPYGEEQNVTSNEHIKFATYYREDSGLDYAMNRYYTSTYGRFTSPDPYRASGGPADPSSWNRYAYVQGDPVNFNDPEGLFYANVSTPNDYICELPFLNLFAMYAYGLDAPPSPYSAIDPTIPGGGKMSMNTTTIAASNTAFKISTGDWDDKPDCNAFLANLIENSGIGGDVSSLVSKIKTLAREAVGNIYDGESSATPLTPDKFGSSSIGGATTVGEWFKKNRRAEALSQMNGSAIFINTSRWNSPTNPYHNNGMPTSYGMGTIFHELLHKVIGSDDLNHHLFMQKSFLTPGRMSLGSKNSISMGLGSICFN